MAFGLVAPSDDQSREPRLLPRFPWLVKTEADGNMLRCGLGTTRLPTACPRARRIFLWVVAHHPGERGALRQGSVPRRSSFW
eukprot:5653687-Pleurochrysis_carterae.AAC.2